MLGALQLLLGAHSPSHPYMGGIWNLTLWKADWGDYARVDKPPSKAMQNATGSDLLLWTCMLEQMGFNLGNTKGVNLIQLIEPFQVCL